VRIIARRTLREFWLKHSPSEQPLRAWFSEAANASWQTPNDIKLRYPSASFLADNRVVFNIAGNNYRLIVHINYPFGIVYVKFIGTHAEYDKVDAETV